MRAMGKPGSVTTTTSSSNTTTAATDKQNGGRDTKQQQQQKQKQQQQQQHEQRRPSYPVAMAIAYFLCVSVAAFILVVYYVFFWTPDAHHNVTGNAGADAPNRTDCTQGCKLGPLDSPPPHPPPPPPPPPAPLDAGVVPNRASNMRAMGKPGSVTTTTSSSNTTTAATDKQNGGRDTKQQQQQKQKQQQQQQHEQRRPSYPGDQRVKHTNLSTKIWVKVAMAIAYFLCVSVAAFILVVYYVFFWTPDAHHNVTGNAGADAPNRTDCTQGSG
ncbi:hypothetical protein CRUP_009670 [Coryphaenoides rupestris]|nr:hypothetical protein CRUP_009670 [Coryphaenoides rupestris]